MSCKFEPQDKWSSRPQNSLYITLYLLNRHGQLGHTFAKYRFWQLTALINISGPIWLIVLFNGMCRGILLSWSFLIVDNVSAQRIFLEASGWTNCCLSGKCKHGWLVLTISTTNIYFHNINEYHIWMVTANGEQMAEVLSYRKRFYSTKSFEKTYSHAW